MNYMLTVPIVDALRHYNGNVYYVPVAYQIKVFNLFDLITGDDCYHLLYILLVGYILIGRLELGLDVVGKVD